MADRKNKFKKVVITTSRKAQKKRGEDKTPSFYQDVGAAMAEDLEKWEKDEREAQKAGKEDEEEFDHSKGSAVDESTFGDRDERNTQ
jgi:hypothetical protein